MGKKKIARKAGGEMDASLKERSLSRVPKKKVLAGILYIDSTYNNTKILLTDASGNAIAWSSTGALGFKGAKKGTPFAAAKVGELIGDKATLIGMKEAKIVIKGVGAGRESALRSFASRGINLLTVSDRTPVPHNGPRPPKPRRV